MGVEHFHFRGGICHYNTVDAVFRAEDGAPIPMSFHPFCGPAFEDAEGEPFYPDENNPLWEQFNGWWRARGRAIYRKDSPADSNLVEIEL